MGIRYGDPRNKVRLMPVFGIRYGDPGNKIRLMQVFGILFSVFGMAILEIK